jgi:hypothetical protein
MKLTARVFMGVLSLLAFAVVPAQGQNAADCANFMKFGIYDKFRTFTTESHYKQVRKFFENNSFHSRQEAQSKADELGLDIKDVLNLDFSGTNSSSSYDVWQQRLLQASFQETMRFGLSASSIETISGKITGLVERCLSQKGLHAYIIPAADNQNFTLTADFAPFSTAQPSVRGTLTITPASVASQCSPNNILGQEVEIGPGGVAISCRRLATETVTVVVNTPPAVGMSAHFTYDAFVVPQPSIRFIATPSTIERGQTSILSWEVKDALNVSFPPDLPSVPSSGSRSVVPTETKEYRLAVTSLDGRRQEMPVTVTVRQPEPPPPTLVGAQVFFRITDDDKDRDTNILVNVDCPVGGTIATISGNFNNRWPDHTDNGPFNMNVLVGQPQNRIAGCVARFVERPNGSDEMHFNWWVELRFSDGTTMRRNGTGNTDHDRPNAHIDF